MAIPPDKSSDKLSTLIGQFMQEVAVCAWWRLGVRNEELGMKDSVCSGLE